MLPGAITGFNKLWLGLKRLVQELATKGLHTILVKTLLSACRAPPLLDSNGGLGNEPRTCREGSHGELRLSRIRQVSLTRSYNNIFSLVLRYAGI